MKPKKLDLAGLISKSVSVPLKSVGIHATVSGWSVAVQADLHYENDLDERLETEFVFPLSEESAVYGFQAEINGRKLEGMLKKREDARDSYR